MTERRFQVLLVDDDRLFWELSQAALEQEDGLRNRLRLTYLPDGAEVMPYLRGEGEYHEREKYPFPELILLDQRMPRQDGTEVLRELRQSDYGLITVCLFSTSAQAKLLREAYRLGANFCIRKPLDFDELHVKLAQIVEFFQRVAELPPLEPEQLVG